MLHADCHPDNYWFAKSSLDTALEICVACESDETAGAGPADFAELAKVKNSVSVMLRDRLFQYTEYWKKEGRSSPPSEEEWYELMEPPVKEEYLEGEKYSEAVVDEDGDEVAGPVSSWPFKARKTGKPTSVCAPHQLAYTLFTVTSAMRMGKILPPHRLGSMSESQKQYAQETERQADEKWEDDDADTWDMALLSTKADREHLRQVKLAREALDAEDALLVAESLERLVVSGVWEQQKQEIQHVDEDTAMEDAPSSLPPLPMSPEASGDEME
jgi:hypothetical protein